MEELRFLQQKARVLQIKKSMLLAEYKKEKQKL